MVLIFLRPPFSTITFGSKYFAFLVAGLVLACSGMFILEVISRNNCPNVKKESRVTPGTCKKSFSVFGMDFDNAKSTLSLNIALGGMEFA